METNKRKYSTQAHTIVVRENKEDITQPTIHGISTYEFTYVVK